MADSVTCPPAAWVGVKVAGPQGVGWGKAKQERGWAFALRLVCSNPELSPAAWEAGRQRSCGGGKADSRPTTGQHPRGGLQFGPGRTQVSLIYIPLTHFHILKEETLSTSFSDYIYQVSAQ